METPEPMRRTAEIEEITNTYVIHPIAGWLTPHLARLGVSANAVSLTGMACGVAAGITYNHYRDSACAIAGLGLMTAWHVLDGVDGQLARLTQTQSPSGKILDGVCDYVTFAAVYTGLAMAMNQDHGAWIWGLVIFAGLCHAVQAAAYEMQRHEYEFWGLGKSAVGLRDLSASANQIVASSFVQRTGDWLYSSYSRLQSIVAGTEARSQRRLLAFAQASPQPTAIRAWYRQVFAPSVRRWSALSANYRTLAIFFCCAIKTPLSYFVFEIIGLGAVLFALLSGKRKLYTKLFEALDAPDRVVYAVAPVSG